MRRADVHCIPVQHVPTLRNEKLLNTPCKSVSRGCNDAMSVSKRFEELCRIKRPRLAVGHR